MKLQELAASPTKQAAKVFESYFGGRIRLNTISRRQTRNLLGRVRGLVQEHRRTPEFHKSEKNPTYLKLIMLEQVLTKKMHEDAMPMAGAIPATTSNPAQAQQERKKALADQITAITKQIEEMNKQKAALQQAMNNPSAVAMENRKHNRLYRRLQESEIQQAQVVLAAQDMVDRVQKMLEDVTSMQFKDLPALCDQVKNEVGVEQSVQFNTDANAALGGLVQNLQASKQQLEQALGVVTGQGGAVPPAMDALGGAGLPDDGQMSAPEMDAEMPADDLEADLDIDANMKTPPAALGRGRR
jgi:NCAIR mutase (PurE)-related protein